MAKNTFKRIYNRVYTIVITPLKEKKYVGRGTSLKYLLYKHSHSKTLVVGFSACHKDGARYNYVSTLKDLPVNRIFIKDDFATNHRGNYYIGENGHYNVEKLVGSLIQETIKKLNIETLIFIGSSKGGYAAVNFAVDFAESHMVVAAPQYYLGDYLNCDYQMENLKNIVGEAVTQEKVEELNKRLQKKIKANNNGATQHLYIHYSKNDHTYEEHIKDMIQDLKEVGVKVFEDVEDYEVHGDLKYYYPQFLHQCVLRIIEKYKK